MKAAASNSKIELYVFLALSLILMSYMILRAYLVPIIFDEAATFFHFVHVGDYWFFTSLPDANNHFLNTALTQISYKLFGSSKLALRLPNLLALPIYLFFLFKIGKRIDNGFIRWTWYLGLMFTHFFVEFFALSRGYGLSMAFLMGVFYHLMIFVDHLRWKNLMWLSVLLFLAEMSNLSILVLSIAIVIYQILFLVYRKSNGERVSRYVLILFIAQIVPLVFSSYYMFYLNNLGSLYYGDNSGFWNLTVQSLILMVSGTNNITYSIVVGVYILILLLGAGGMIRKDGFQVLAQEKFVFPVLLILTVIGIVLLSEFFGINNPEDRVAMYFIPLFLGSVPMLMDMYNSSYRQLIFPAIAIPLLLLPYHFIRNVNTEYVNGYKTEVLPESFLETVSEDELSTREFPPTIGGYRMRMFCWTYQNFQNGGYHNIIDYQSYPESQSDFQIVDIDEHPVWLEKYDVIDEEDVLGRKLLKRKKQIQRRFFDSENLTIPTVTDNEFTRLALWDKKNLPHNSYYVTVDLNIHSSSIPFHAWVAMQMIDTENKSILYKNIPLDWLRTRWSEDNPEFKHSFLTGPIPENCSEIRFYIWNIDKREFTLNSSKIKMYSLND